ncbi:sheath terminator protein [Microcystis phage vB_MweS-yong2]|nr:sheath terminator protein [Microcystis phage vB_MweS-yong2]
MKVKLADPAHILPWPGAPGRFLAGDAVADVDPDHPFWRECLADGSVIPAPASAPAKPSKHQETN